jgi:anti-sigma28 factor (negative regulator of flagellin synthesis)
MNRIMSIIYDLRPHLQYQMTGWQSGQPVAAGSLDIVHRETTEQTAERMALDPIRAERIESLKVAIARRQYKVATDAVLKKFLESICGRGG